MNASIIGSFHRFYEDAIGAMKLFRGAGIDILSPKESTVVDPAVEFVYLETDDQLLSPAEIQLIAFHRILRSDFVFVCCPGGYVGLTTCFEIGMIVARQIPLFFSEVPKDLPIFLPRNSVWTPHDLVQFYTMNHRLPALEGSMSTPYAEQLHVDLMNSRFHS